MNWDDFRYLLALREAGSLGGAARALKVDPSTVGRRLSALEASLGVQLVTRTPERAVLTDAGAIASEAAQDVERRIVQLVRTVGGERAAPVGTVRVSVAEGVAGMLPRVLADLRDAHPGICMELLISAGAVDLLRREADLAVRLFRPKEPEIVARKVGEIGWSLYAAAAYLERRAFRGTLAGHDVIGFGDMIARSPGGAWLDANTAGATIVLRGTTVPAVLNAAKAGIGIAVLPCFATAGDPTLHRLVPEVLASTETFVAMPPEHRETRRVRIVADAIAGFFERERALLAGDDHVAAS